MNIYKHMRLETDINLFQAHTAMEKYLNPILIPQNKFNYVRNFGQSKNQTNKNSMKYQLNVQDFKVGKQINLLKNQIALTRIKKVILPRNLKKNKETSKNRQLKEGIHIQHVQKLSPIQSKSKHIPQTYEILKRERILRLQDSVLKRKYSLDYSRRDTKSLEKIEGSHAMRAKNLSQNMVYLEDFISFGHEKPRIQKTEAKTNFRKRLPKLNSSLKQQHLKTQA